MKWRKIGKIFDPGDHELADNCTEFAQSPQALVFDDFVRIYFSTRKRDRSGKYLSCISFVDMEKNLREIIDVASHTVVELGKLGCYDEHGIFPLNVLRHKDRILGYIGGWSRRVSVSIETSIGLAISSDDGITFQRIGDGPVLTSSPQEPFLVGDPSVAFFDNQFYMWYIFGTQWKRPMEELPPERTYKIGHAISGNGISWTKWQEGRQAIPDHLGNDECQAMPCVIHLDGLYRMFFCYRESFDFRENRERSYRIGYAYSDDLVNWTRDDGAVGIDASEEGWDSEMICYPRVFRHEGEVYMLYNGNEFGRHGFGLAVLEET